MQLSQIGKPNTKEFEFIDPYTDEATGIFVTLHSLKSKHGKEALHAMQLQAIELRGEKEELADEDTMNLNIGLLLNLFEKFRGIDDDNGKAIKSTKANFDKALRESTELFSACLVFISNAGNFSRKQEKAL